MCVKILRAKLRPSMTRMDCTSAAHFAFETGAIDPREDSFRYLNGTPHIPALYACRPGLDILNKVGIAAIREKSIRMTTRLIEGAKSRGWRVNTPENPAERAGTVSIECPHAYEVCCELLAREILVDFRPKAACVFPPRHFTTGRRVRLHARTNRRDLENRRLENMQRRSHMRENEEFAPQISNMLEAQLRRRGMTDAVVLAAMESVPVTSLFRKSFVRGLR